VIGEPGVWLDEGFTATVRAPAESSAAAVDLDDAQVKGGLTCTDALLSSDAGSGLSAARIRVTGNLRIDRSSISASASAGAVALLDAHLGGNLVLQEDSLVNAAGPALYAPGATIGNMALFRRTVASAGAEACLDLTRARVGHLYLVHEAIVRAVSGPALNAGEAVIAGDLLLDASIVAVGGPDSAASLDVQRARVGGAFQPVGIDCVAHLGEHPDALWEFDGLTYAGLPWGGTRREWIWLLTEFTPGYAAQPYQYLAAAYRAAGHDRDAREVLIAQRRDQIARGNLVGRV
jgi:hypothetical protein